MGFFDLNIPYHESDRHVTDKSSLKSRRLKLALKAMELGYTGIAYNRTLKGIISESDRCAIPLFPLSSLLKLAPSSSYFSAAVKFHRDLLNVAVSTAFRQYTRLTLIVDSAAPVLKSSNGILKSYDIVAVRPVNQNAFDQACKTSEVDIIAIDFSEKLPFRLKQPMVKAAIKRGVYFEITYSSFIMDAQARREMMSNCKLLVDWTRGNNLIFSSAAPSVTELRGPYDVANLFSLLGLSKERAKAAISRNCRSILANALRKKHFYKEAIKVEEIPSRGQINSEPSPFDDWLKWDPISSGDGDLLLDDMEKSFSASSNVAKTVKTIDFTSSMNGVPAHGLQIKDIISLKKVAPEPPDNGKYLSLAKETEAAIADYEMPVEQIGVNPLPEEHDSLNAVVRKQGKLNPFPEESQTSLEDDRNIYQVPNCEKSKILLDPLPKEQGELISLPEDGQISLNDVTNKYQVSGCEDSEMSDLPTNIGTSNYFTDFDEHDTVSIEKLRNSSKLDRNSVRTELTDSQLPSCVPSCRTSVLADGSLVFNSTSFSDGPLVQLSALLNDICFPANIEESNVENSVDLVLSAQEGIVVNTVQNKLEREKEKEPILASPDISSQNGHMEREQLKERISTSVSSGDGLAIEEYINPIVNENSAAKYVPMVDNLMSEKKQINPVTSYRLLDKSQAGRGRAKRRATYKPFSFPFKGLLNPKPFKRKAQKSKSLITM
ncbi:uncharacterized protein Fot_41106 [Forsythia ovata]|uniref:Uncharacterized protein n=1 Tax=Forsythia ovata TaxID=205694 RepID=A0ABD1RID5_9LAMI